MTDPSADPSADPDPVDLEAADLGSTDLDYARVERAILFLDERAAEQPTLDEVADHLGMSPFHTQRLFTRWAGVSPKRFLQYVTLEHAKRLLRGSDTVLEATHAVGLSGPSRLHDLSVTLEGVTPGEVRTAGRGVDIGWGVHPSPFGPVFVAATDRGITALEFLSGGDAAAPLESLRRAWPEARIHEDPRPTSRLAGRIFGEPLEAALTDLLDDPGDGGPARLRLQVRGTNFQIRVWKALLGIPPGAAVTYGDLARAIGRPGAERAVGSALGRNPVAVLIPCHRVLRSTGGFGGYRWGDARKRALLAWESVRFERDGEEISRGGEAIGI